MTMEHKQHDDDTSHEDHGEHSNHDQHHGHHGHMSHHEHMVKDFKRRFIVSIILTLPIAWLSPMLRELAGFEASALPGRNFILFAFATAVFLYGGWPFLKGLRDELGKRQPGMMTLIALAIAVAYGYSGLVTFGLEGKVFFWELASLIDIMLLGHWIEMRSIMGASGAVAELAKLIPGKAHKLAEDGSSQDVNVEDLANGDVVLVKPGEKIPADGTITDGNSGINEAMLTGEAALVNKGPSDEVIGGSVNGDGSLTVEVKNVGKDSFLNQVMTMVSEAQESKSRAQGLADRAAMWLTYVALASGAVTMALWLTVFQHDFVFSLERTVTVMIITCPHALGLAIPLVVAMTTAIGAKQGFFIRNRTPFERARNVQAVLFDKTGTLTKGQFEVSDVIVFRDEWDKETVLNTAAAVERRSEHPIGKAIVEAAPSPYESADFENIKGKGAQATVNDETVKIVSRSFVDENDMPYDADRVDEIAAEGKTFAFLVTDNSVAGCIALDDAVRDESLKAVSTLKDMGIRVMMITGDNQAVAERVANELQLDDFFAEVLPDQKAEKVKEIQNKGLICAMTGDGVNDSPALAQADVGIAIGAGTDVAQEAADIVLVKSNPMDVVNMINLSKVSRRKTIQNLFWATGYNALAIPLAAGILYPWGVLLNPAAGAVLMSLSTVIVAINAKLMRPSEVTA